MTPVTDQGALTLDSNQPPLRVLLLSQHFWPESFRINDVAWALLDSGCTLTVLTGQPNYPAGQIFAGYRAGDLGCETHRGLRIYRVPLIPRGRGGALRLLSNYFSFLGSAATLGAWQLRRESFDVVFVYGTSPILQALAAIVIARIKGAALVTWVQDLWPQSLVTTGYVKNARALAAVQALVSWIYRRNVLLLVPSKGFQGSVTPLAGGRPVRYLPNPGEYAQPHVGPAALQLQAGFTLLFAGNLGKAQSLETLLDAAALLQDLSDFRLVLVGSGQLSEWLHEEIARRKLRNVELPGRFDPAQIPAILAQASALLVSLNADPAMALTIPAKVQTYLAAGRPIIASLDGEGAQLVTEAGAGLACPAGDAQALAQAVRRLHATPDTERAAMGARGRAYFDAHFAPLPLARKLMAELEAARQAHAAQRAPR